MVVKEFYQTRPDGIILNRIYSDSGFYIQKENTEEVYTEAIDCSDCNYTYKETDILIPGRARSGVSSSGDWNIEGQAAYLKGVNEA